MKILPIAASLLLCASAASAQGRGHPPRPRPERPQSHAEQSPRRDALEQRFRQRSEEIVKQRLNLSDQQVTRLRGVNADIAAKRNALLDQERSVRSGLRDEMAKGSGADQNKVAQLLTQAHDLQSQRFALQQDEQQQLSSFMSPVQVAQYVGLQAQIRQRIREMQKGQPDQPPNL
jgi:hypothetical protein